MERCKITESDPTIFFDGVCNLCNRLVQFVLRYERRPYFHFKPLQHSEHSVDDQDPNTIIVVDNGKEYRKSAAAFRIARRLKFPFHFITIFSILPRSIADRLYDWIAAHRYRWFGKRESCSLPKPEWKHRFEDYKE